MKRKTITVELVKEIINNQLAIGYWNQEQKKALASVLETILMDTGNYNGFNSADWLDHGFREWYNKKQETGDKHLSTIPYLGEQYNRRYY